MDNLELLRKEDHRIRNKIQTILFNISSYNNKKVYKEILGLLDLTTLEGSDNKQKIDSLCKKATSFSSLAENTPNPAAVCVYPVFVKQAKEILKDQNINVASVAGAFPSGQSPLKVKLAEVQYAIDEGADEIDMVISRGKMLEGDYNAIFEEINAIKGLCENKTRLKVILETGELLDHFIVKKASEIAIEAGADFIKTSTGKIQPAATLESSYVMLEVIKKHYENTGKKVGFKPAGGISTVKLAVKYYCLVLNVLGEEWLNKDLFRIGASRLADALVEEIK